MNGHQGQAVGSNALGSRAPDTPATIAIAQLHSQVKVGQEMLAKLEARLGHALSPATQTRGGIGPDKQPPLGGSELVLHLEEITRQVVNTNSRIDDILSTLEL